jgi:hypothetical protein
MTLVALSALFLAFVSRLTRATNPTAEVMALFALTLIFGPFVWLVYRAIEVFSPR